MPEYTLPSEKQIIDDAIKEKDEIKKARAVYEKQALVNVAFLYGKHYFTIEQKPISGLDERIVWELKNLERKNKVRRTSNYILPLFRAALANMIMMKSHVTIEPTTTAERDKNSARVSQEAAEDFWQNCNKNNPILSQQKNVGMLMILIKLFTYLLAVGQGYLKPYFNRKARASAFIQGNIIPEAEIGEVEVKVLHLFTLYHDLLRRYYIETEVLPVDYVMDYYDVDKLEPEDIEQEHEKRLMSLLDSPYEIKYKDACLLHQKYELPSKKHKEGRHIIFTEKKLIYNGPLPPEYKGKLPYFDFSYLDFFFSPFAQGIVEQLISLQEDYNFTITRLYSYKKWLTGKILIPRGAKVSTKWDDEVGQYIFYNAGQGKPEYAQTPGAPADLFNDALRIRRDMEDVASRHDASMGRTPTGVKSGIGIQNMTELDANQITPNLISIEQQLSYFLETALNIMSTRYTEGRLMTITGNQMLQEIGSFIGSDLIGNRRVKVSLGSSLPASKEAREQKIMGYLGAGLITPEKARELLEFGDIEGVFHSLDETAEKTEIQQMLRPGIEVIAEPWEEHVIRVKVLTDFMKSQEFMQLPTELRQKFIEHLTQHQEFLRQEQMAAQRVAASPIPGGK